MFLVRQSHKVQNKAIAARLTVQHIHSSRTRLNVSANLIPVVPTLFLVPSSLGLMMAILLQPKHVALPLMDIRCVERNMCCTKLSNRDEPP